MTNVIPFPPRAQPRLAACTICPAGGVLTKRDDGDGWVVDWGPRVGETTIWGVDFFLTEAAADMFVRTQNALRAPAPGGAE